MSVAIRTLLFHAPVAWAPVAWALVAPALAMTGEAAVVAQEASLVPADVAAALACEPAQAEIGQPLTWTLAVEHPVDVPVTVPTGSPLPDDSWVLVEEARRTTRASAPGRRTTVVSWGVISLEPGERELPVLAVEFDAAGAPRHVEAAAGTVTVNAALAEGEDAPRPPVGFRPAPEERGPLSLWPLWAVAGVLLAGIALLVWRRVRRRDRGAPAPPAPVERLAALEARRAAAGEEPEEVRGLYYELSAIVREAVDRRAQPTGSAAPPTATALTDEEWLTRLRQSAPSLPAAVPDTVEELLRRAEAVKYGQGAPTRFAVDEAFAEARGVVETLASATPIEGAGRAEGGEPS